MKRKLPIPFYNIENESPIKKIKKDDDSDQHETFCEIITSDSSRGTLESPIIINEDQEEDHTDYSIHEYKPSSENEIYILKYMLDSENNYTLPKIYVSNQILFLNKNRKELIEWIFLIHSYHRFSEETIHLTVYIIDAYLSKKSIDPSKLRLLGITAFLMSSKIQEYSSPAILKLLNFTNKDNVYEVKDVKCMEIDILTVLHGNLHFYSVYNFFDSYTAIIKKAIFSNKNYEISKLIVEYKVFLKTGIMLMRKQLIEGSFLKYLPSMIAAINIWMSLKNTNIMLKELKQWPEELRVGTGYEFNRIKDCALDIT